MLDERKGFKPRYQEESAGSSPITGSEIEEPPRVVASSENYEVAPTGEEIAKYGGRDADYPEAKPARVTIWGKVTHGRNEEMGNGSSGVPHE